MIGRSNDSSGSNTEAAIDMLRIHTHGSSFVDETAENMRADNWY